MKLSREQVARTFIHPFSYLFSRVAFLCAVTLFGIQAAWALSPYSEDFEGMNAAASSDLANNGWLVGANVYADATLNTVVYDYFAFTAPQNTGAFSDVGVGQGGASQGTQQLSVYSDYNNPDQATRWIQAHIFQEQTGLIAASDVGVTYTFTFDVKVGNLLAPSTADAFIKVLRSSDGSYDELFTDAIGTDTLGASWSTQSLSVTIDAAWVGETVQFGFRNVATTFNPSGVFYDNISFTAPATPTTGDCTVPCTLIWEDDFDGNTLDLDKWEYQYGDGTDYGVSQWGNNEKQLYTDTHAHVSGGVLTIEAVEVNAWDGTASLGDYESSRIRTRNKGDWAYGRFEARIQLPQNQGQTTGGEGIWPAFWLLPYNSPYGGRGWPFMGEIDIMEWLGDNPNNLFGTIHYPVNAGDTNSANSGGNTFLPSPLDWHTYAIEWEPGEIRWYLDNSSVPFLTRNSWSSGDIPFPAPFDAPNFHIILNMAVGGNFPGDPDATSIFPQEFKIDYVRVYDMGHTITPTIPALTDPILFDDFEHADVASQWGIFAAANAGGVRSNSANVPPTDGGTNAMDVGFVGSQGAFWGTIFHNQAMDLSAMTQFSFWINPDGAANEDYVLEINIQDDDSAEGSWTPNRDEEFQFNCRVSATGPCAIVGGGWQKVTIPISDFVFDGTFGTFVDGVLNTEAGGNGLAEQITVAVIDQPGGATQANFLTDFWLFECVGETCVEPADVNVPVPVIALLGMSLSLGGIVLWTRRRKK